MTRTRRAQRGSACAVAAVLLLAACTTEHPPPPQTAEVPTVAEPEPAADGASTGERPEVLSTGDFAMPDDPDVGYWADVAIELLDALWDVLRRAHAEGIDSAEASDGLAALGLRSGRDELRAFIEVQLAALDAAGIADADVPMVLGTMSLADAYDVERVLLERNPVSCVGLELVRVMEIDEPGIDDPPPFVYLGLGVRDDSIDAINPTPWKIANLGVVEGAERVDDLRTVMNVCA